jgi:DNA-binding NtrC family response regulator
MGKVKILIVDDDQIILDSCRRILEAEGLQVSMAQSADVALKLLNKGDFGLVLIDVKMPEYDGMHLIRKIKKKKPELTIILMSGYPTMETITEGFRIGATKFIAKPFTPEELLVAVRQVNHKEKGHVYKQSELQ